MVRLVDGEKATEAWRRQGHTVTAAVPAKPDQEVEPSRKVEDQEMTITHPAGFTAAGVAAGLKSTGAKDLALVVNQGPTFDSASVFTANRCKANPILWSQEVVKDGTVKAVVLNSGGANCYTGADGFQTTHAVAEKVAELVGIGAIDVVVCSTGLIGLANDRDDLLAGVESAYAALSADGGDGRRRGDHDHRLRGQDVVVEGAGWSIGGMAKGAGMLAPQLATMLVVHHHRRRRAGRRARRRPARLDPGQLRPPRLRRLHVHQRHRDGDGQRRQRHHARRRRTSPQPSPRRAPTWRCSCSRTPRAPTTRSRSPPSTRPPRTTPSRSSRSVARSNLFKAAVFGKRPQLGPGARQHGHHRRGLRPGRPRRRDERRVGLPQLHARPRIPPRSTSTAARSP